MIDNFEFIDKNANGEKEKYLGGTLSLKNKLSAQETNNIRSKLNEIIAVANYSDVPLFSNFALKYKADGNLNLQVIEVGDIAHRYSSAGVVDNAIFNGGDSQDPLNYTILSSGGGEVFCERFTATGQTCTLPADAVAISAMVDGYPNYLEQSGFETDLNTFTQIEDEVTFKMPLDPNSQILITYKL